MEKVEEQRAEDSAIETMVNRDLYVDDQTIMDMKSIIEKTEFHVLEAIDVLESVQRYVGKRLDEENAFLKYITSNPRINSIDAQGTAVNRDPCMYESTIMKMEMVIEKLESVIEKQAAKIKDLRREVSELTSTIEVLKASLKDAHKSSDTDLNRCKEEVRSLNNEINRLYKHIQEVSIAHGCGNDEPNVIP